MSKYVNLPCNSSLATSCAKSVMTSSEGRVATLFTEGVSSSVEWKLAIDETASTVSLAPNVYVLPRVSAAVQGGEECVEEFVDHLGGEESAARHFVLEGEGDDNDSFVDIMNGITAGGDAESEGWTFADALARGNISVETLQRCCWHTSFANMCVFFLHSPLVFILSEEYGGHSYFP